MKNKPNLEEFVKELNDLCQKHKVYLTAESDDWSNSPISVKPSKTPVTYALEGSIILENFN